MVNVVFPSVFKGACFLVYCVYCDLTSVAPLLLCMFFGLCVEGMTTAAGSSAESEALKITFDYMVNSIDTTALLPKALSRHLIT